MTRSYARSFKQNFSTPEFVCLVLNVCVMVICWRQHLAGRIHLPVNIFEESHFHVVRHSIVSWPLFWVFAQKFCYHLLKSS